MQITGVIRVRQDSFTNDKGEKVEYRTLVIADPATGEALGEFDPKRLEVADGSVVRAHLRLMRGGQVLVLDEVMLKQ